MKDFLNGRFFEWKFFRIEDFELVIFSMEDFVIFYGQNAIKLSYG